MKRFILHSRNDLLDAMHGRCRTTACNRSIYGGKVVVLGRFSSPEGFEGTWPITISIVESAHGKKWIVAVCPEPSGIRIKHLDSIDWAKWTGNPSGLPGMINGDDPWWCYGNHMEALEKQNVQQK